MQLVGNFKLHSVWILIAVSLIVGGGIWQAIASGQAGRSVGGSSLVGLVVGSVAAAIILFELLLWPRKRLRRRKLGPTRYWMAGHIWMGIASGPLAFIHSGYRFGGEFSSALMYLLLFVLASGIYGWIMQMFLPRWMLANLPSETICGQIDDVSIQNALDARRMLTVAYGPKPDGLTKLTNLNEASVALNQVRVAGQSSSLQTAIGTTSLRQNRQGQIVVGAVQRRGPLRGRSNLEGEIDVEPEDTMVIWKEYAAVIDCYLLNNVKCVPDGRRTLGTELRNYQKAKNWFSLLRDACSPKSSAILDRLEELCDQKRQFDLQRRAQAWLHCWIAIHASTSIVLGVVLVAHIVLAIRYM